jgi:hypothetical protein
MGQDIQRPNIRVSANIVYFPGKTPVTVGEEISSDSYEPTSHSITEAIGKPVLRGSVQIISPSW